MTTSTRVRSDRAPLVARLVADEPTDGTADEVGHAVRRRPGRQPAGLEDDDPPIAEPRLVEQGERDDGGLARRRAGR